MLLTEIDHVAIAVRDLEAAIDYYRDTFGCEVEHREVVERDGVEEALLKVADSYVQLLTPTRADSPPRAANKLLSQREQDVLELLAQGYTNKEVGTRLCLSVKTIETHRAHIGDKLGLRSRADLTRYALEVGSRVPAPSVAPGTPG